MTRSDPENFAVIGNTFRSPALFDKHEIRLFNRFRAGMAVASS
jgi:hypothetical protein